MTTPDLIFNLQYRATEYYHSKSSSNLQQVSLENAMEYYDRDDAVDKTTLESAKTSDAFDYYNYRIGSCGAFNEKGDVEYDQLKQNIEQYKPDIMYRAVLSFTDEFASENNLKPKKNMAKLIQKSMPSMIKEMGLDTDNVEWYGFYHTNTGHPHVHLVFYEKERTKKLYRLQKEQFGKVKSKVYSMIGNNVDLYIDKGESKKAIFSYLKEEMHFKERMVHYLNNGQGNRKLSEKTKILTDSEVDSLFRLKLSDLEKKLPKKGSMKLNSINMKPYHEDIKELVSLLKQDPNIKDFMDRYEKILDKQCQVNESQYGEGFNRDEFMFDSLYRIEPKMAKDKNGEMKPKEVYSIDAKLANLILANIKAYRMDSKSYDQLNIHPQKKNSLRRQNVRTRVNNLKYAAANDLTRAISKSFFQTLEQEQEARDVYWRARQEQFLQQY